jgi:cell wall-associated NlpC family hydrolase
MHLLVTKDKPLVIHPGDIFITRNKLDEQNETPGYWNHASIYIGNGLILEAQPEPNAVITSDVQKFYDRYPYVAILRYDNKNWQVLGLNAAVAAQTSQGLVYRKLASMTRFLRRKDRGENCVSLVRRAWRKAVGFDFIWHLPDGIYKDNRFQMIHIKGVAPTI